MPSIKVKRTTAAVPSTLEYGELGIAKDELYFGDRNNKPVQVRKFSDTINTRFYRHNFQLQIDYQYYKGILWFTITSLEDPGYLPAQIDHILSEANFFDTRYPCVGWMKIQSSTMLVSAVNCKSGGTDMELFGTDPNSSTPSTKNILIKG